MEFDSPAIRHLDRLSIPYRVFTHPSPPGSLEMAARERRQEIHQIVRSILFRYRQEFYVLVLMAGPYQISWNVLRKYLKVPRLSLASESEVKEVTGYVIGTVSPIGLRKPVRILADKNAFLPEEISLGSGISGTAIIMKSQDLLKTLGSVEVGNFKK